MLAMELQQVLKLDVKEQRRKRKRNKMSSNPNDKETASRCRCRPLGSFAADDVMVIVQVLKRVSVYTLPLLDGLLSGLARDLRRLE